MKAAVGASGGEEEGASTGLDYRTNNRASHIVPLILNEPFIVASPCLQVMVVESGRGWG